MYHVYILENEQGKHYIGYTGDLLNRLIKHNSGSSKWTKHKGPWKIVYQKEYSTKEEAYKRERQIKKYKGGEAFRKIIRRDARAA